MDTCKDGSFTRPSFRLSDTTNLTRNVHEIPTSQQARTESIADRLHPGRNNGSTEGGQ